MSNTTELQKVSEETMRFMRGKYRLDEVPCTIDANCIKFRQGKKTILAIYIYEDSKTYHDGKWMMIPVADLDTLEAVKKLILIKKNPNRKQFPKENARKPKIEIKHVLADDVIAD